MLIAYNMPGTVVGDGDTSARSKTDMGRVLLGLTLYWGDR